MRKILFLVFLLSVSPFYAQQPEKLNSSEIYKELQKLNFLGSVLYVGAHPDDENTRLISWFSNELHSRTAYLSLTRGDGGQNLIGPELRELLGVIRTQELLAARGIDGGQQFFTRANDFGYSKNPQETFDIWNKNEILSDVVWIFRNFKPDVIVNRFSANSAGETHGHHTASAILSSEAFQLSGDKSAFQDQLEIVETWNPKRLFWNTSSWFFENENEFEKAKQDFISFDTGVYYPLLGFSNTEIAALSRSRHQSQGFGSTGSRGSETEYLKLISGEKISSENAIFEGINTSWSRLEGGEVIGEILSAVQKNYNFQNPSASIPGLVEAYELIQ
ncbi:MAG TPA: PIG-L family deacetylase, partial [Salinimicrobium sp.]|nr:PIG-L family deacetylase [Salinimicrobium sp.]